RGNRLITASIYGRTGTDPKPGQTKTGKPMCSVSVAVDIGKDSEPETLWVSILAFGKGAEALQRHAKGDMIAAMGRLSRSHYTGSDGKERESWTLLAEALHSSRTVRPNAGRKPGNIRREPVNEYPENWGV
ncbi:MAG: single-stranded DNA-binding protein, partial [Methylococcaceae bacterium]|nr:single-stranded DNA-binding protein [Methylococcaceae bacterium]